MKMETREIITVIERGRASPRTHTPSQKYLRYN